HQVGRQGDQCRRVHLVQHSIRDGRWRQRFETLSLGSVGTGRLGVVGVNDRAVPLGAEASVEEVEVRDLEGLERQNVVMERVVYGVPAGGAKRCRQVKQ